ncbi:MAG TPA: membrane protein insertion efficiency factor YidD, partial [Delftia acidovorans]|nr:membrane protein insertion efficiency factor YidD [Delftia acidovorans]
HDPVPEQKPRLFTSLTAAPENTQPSSPKKSS